MAMRRILVMATLALALQSGAARAGVYDLDDPAQLRIPPLPYEYDYNRIKQILAPLRAAAVPIVSDQAAEKLKQLADDLENTVSQQENAIAEVQAKLKSPAANAADEQLKASELKAAASAARLKLAACYLRMRRPNDAVRALAWADDTNYLVRLYRRTAQLEAKEQGDRTTTDKVGLGACYIRLGRPNDAIGVLSSADQEDFLVLANLAAAYGHPAVKELERAVSYEEQALNAWPATLAGWSGEELAYYRRAEVYNLKLLRLRAREAIAGPTNKPWDAMDALFDKPRLPAGDDYKPGIESWRIWGELPPDGYVIVSQLLVWSPDDDRLYWQLGELLNMMGRVADAASILTELADQRKETGVRELMRRRSILKDAVSVANAFNDAYQPNGKPDAARFYSDFNYLMWAVSPPGLLVIPGGGDIAYQTAMATRAQVYAAQAQAQQQQPSAPPGPSPAASRGWQPDWQLMLIGFAAGAIVAAIAALQWTEWRRRRQTAAAAPSAALSPSRPTEPAAHDAGAFADPSAQPAAPDRMEGAP
jgi:hypothetical protein